MTPNPRNTSNDATSARLVWGLAAVVLLLVAAVLAGVLFGREWLVDIFGAGTLARKYEKKFVLKRQAFAGLSPEIREAFDVGVLHDDASKEWWYINAHLFDDHANMFAVMIAMLKDGRLYGVLSDVRNKQRAIIAVPETTVSFDPASRSFSVGAATLTQPDPAYLCYDFVVARDDVSIDLDICAEKPPIAIGETGTIRMGESGESKYYSMTNAVVRGSGRLGAHQTNFVGRGWIDRQWGNWHTWDFDKWDWFSIQLENNTEILLFQFWKDGRIIHQFGDICLPNQQSRSDFRFRSTAKATWLSPETGVRWDTAWVVIIPEYEARFELTADFENQEIDRALWEGGIGVAGRWQGEVVRGRGFFEARRRHDMPGAPSRTFGMPEPSTAE
ncbi:hypothetical protein K8I61_18055 [bacterium]|nr:hypothetical protein [bacterium]